MRFYEGKEARYVDVEFKLDNGMKTTFSSIEELLDGVGFKELTSPTLAKAQVLFIEDGKMIGMSWITIKKMISIVKHIQGNVGGFTGSWMEKRAMEEIIEGSSSFQVSEWDDEMILDIPMDEFDIKVFINDDFSATITYEVWIGNEKYDNEFYLKPGGTHFEDREDVEILKEGKKDIERQIKNRRVK